MLGSVVGRRRLLSVVLLQFRCIRYIQLLASKRDKLPPNDLSARPESGVTRV